MIKLLNGDCIEYLKTEIPKNKKIVFVTDPPFNVGYKYNQYTDKMDQTDYLDMLQEIFSDNPFVMINYPEICYEFLLHIGEIPKKVVSWVYNSNNQRQHRDIVFCRIEPDLNLVKQPYKNPNDKRIKERKSGGARIYDWWEINQIKNVSKEKYDHPCQMPFEVMDRIIGVLPDKENLLVIDPFMGTGTTGVACKKHLVDFLGIEIDKKYYQIAKDRLNDIQPTGQMTIFTDFEKAGA